MRTANPEYEGTSMMWSKSCPRCERGDVLFEEERDGFRVRCAQCGYSREVDSQYEASRVLQQGGLTRQMLLEQQAL